MTNQRIKIFTGNFANVSKYKDCFPVSIALYNKFWEGACYRPLNPTWDMMQHESEEYTKMYYAKLRKMDAKTVYDDLCIDDADKLKIVTVTSTVLHQAQKAYIKKVYKTMTCRYGYIVMYDKYTLGGFGFDYPKNTSYDMLLLSDFSTNNNVPRIAKLILLCVQSEYVKRSMSRKLRMIARNMYTKVYTQAPVSMKYRGLFKKVGQKQGHLIYESDFGTSGSIEQIINQYKQILERAKK